MHSMRMKLVVRVQYIGERARLLLRDDQAAEYTRGLIDDLESFGFPLPHEQKPIEKSGFMLCVWHVDRDSEVHRAIQSGFMNAKAEAASLINRNIRYVSLNEDGVMHTTSLSHKAYKPKTYIKQDYQTNSYQKSFGKAPKYPTVISQARQAATPLSQRITGAEILGHSAYHFDPGVGEPDMQPDSGARTPPATGSDGSNSVIDVTQQTLKQLSQSSAFQILLQRGPAVSTSVKVEPVQADLSPMPSHPVNSPPQPEIRNLQALLEKAGVKSASAQALLSAQSSRSSIGTGLDSVPIITPIPATSSLGTQISLPISSSTAHAQSASTPTPSAAGPRTSAGNAATRELWDVRRQITALQARENSLVLELQRLGQPVPQTESGNMSDQRVKALEGEVEALREELLREAKSRKLMSATLRAEKLRRAEAEVMVKDTRRECKQPFVVPALLEAFLKIGQMTGDALKDGHGGGGVAMEL